MLEYFYSSLTWGKIETALEGGTMNNHGQILIKFLLLPRIIISILLTAFLNLMLHVF